VEVVGKLGGMTSRQQAYFEKLKDPRWQKKRLEVFQRDKFRCMNCGSKEKTLHVNHLKYDGEPWDSPMEYLETLCEDCHEIRTAFDDFWKNYWSPNKCVIPTFNISQGLYQLTKLSKLVKTSIEEVSKLDRLDDVSTWPDGTPTRSEKAN
jgi:transposase